MSVKIRAFVTKQPDMSKIEVKIFGLTDKKMGDLAENIVVTAKANAEAIQFEKSKGDLAEKIRFKKLERMHYEIESYSGHLSFIELGTQYIKGRNPVLWPAYRTEKKKFFSGGKWV